MKQKLLVISNLNFCLSVKVFEFYEYLNSASLILKTLLTNVCDQWTRHRHSERGRAEIWQMMPGQKASFLNINQKFKVVITY
jgi:hypothetical protein